MVEDRGGRAGWLTGWRDAGKKRRKTRLGRNSRTHTTAQHSMQCCSAAAAQATDGDRARWTRFAPAPEPTQPRPARSAGPLPPHWPAGGTIAACAAGQREHAKHRPAPRALHPGPAACMRLARWGDRQARPHDRTSDGSLGCTTNIQLGSMYRATVSIVVSVSRVSSCGCGSGPRPACRSCGSPCRRTRASVLVSALPSTARRTSPAAARRRSCC